MEMRQDLPDDSYLPRKCAILQEHDPIRMLAHAPPKDQGTSPRERDFPTMRSCSNPRDNTSQLSTSMASMAYKNPYESEWLPSAPSSPSCPAPQPKIAAEVDELMIEVEKKVPRRWSQTPNPRSIRRQHHHLPINLRQNLVQDMDIVEYECQLHRGRSRAFLVCRLRFGEFSALPHLDHESWRWRRDIFA